jgi:hypothetical protein
LKLYQRIMRFLAPACERQREEFRHEVSRATAHAEDLQRTVIQRGGEIAKVIEEGSLKGGRLP